MAPRGFRPCYSPRRNLPPINYIEDELAKDLGLIEGSHSGNTSSTLSYNPILDPVLVPALISAPVLITASTLPFFNELLR